MARKVNEHAGAIVGQPNYVLRRRALSRSIVDVPRETALNHRMALDWNAHLVTRVRELCEARGLAWPWG